MIKVAYLLSPFVAQMQIPGTRRTYKFGPWAYIEEKDWDLLKSKTFMFGCNCNGGKPEELRVFGSEQEVRDGLLGFHR